jgi:hypothetical protein
VLAAVTALVFAGGAANAYRLPPLSMWGDVYDHVPNHLVSAGIALLVALALLGLAGRATTARARRTSVLTAAAWGLVSAVFVVDAIGGGIGDRTGDYTVHDVAGVLVPVTALLLLTSSVLLVLTRGGWAPWPLRLAGLASVPGTLALNQSSSAGWLTAGLVAAAVWTAVAVHALRRPVRAAADDGAPARS